MKYTFHKSLFIIVVLVFLLGQVSSAWATQINRFRPPENAPVIEVFRQIDSFMDVRDFYINDDGTRELDPVAPGLQEASLELLRRQLSAERVSDRVEAARQLGRLGGEKAVECLALAARIHVNKEVREAAVGSLIQILKEGDSGTRRSAAKALGKISEATEIVVPELIQALRNENIDVRSAIIDSLFKIGGSTALREALKDEDQEVCVIAARCLVEMGEDIEVTIPILIEALKNKNVNFLAVSALGKIGKDAIPALIEALNDKNQCVRNSAAMALSQIGEDAVPMLIEELNSNNEDAIYLASWALYEIGEDAAPALIEALKNKSRKVLLNEIPYEAHTLIKIGEDAVPALIEALNDEYQPARCMIMYILSEIGDSRAIAVLTEAFKDENEDVRNVAAWSLAKIGKDAIPALIEALNDENQIVYTSAECALIQIGEDAVPMVTEELKSENERMRCSAAVILNMIGEDAKAAVPALIEVLEQDVYANARRCAAEALGNIGDSRAIEALEIAKNDPDSDVRKAAMTALELIKK